MSLRLFRTLRARLVLGAALIGLIAVLASGLTIRGMTLMSDQVAAAVTAEQRIQRFSVLASQIGSLIVVLYEAAQSGLDADERSTRLTGLEESIRRSFAQVRVDLDREVAAAETAGLDEQSRRATRSLGIARMEALFDGTLDRISRVDMGAAPEIRNARMQGQINAFSIGFDPLLNAAITDERRARDAAIAEIATLRAQLTRAALVVVGLAIVLVSGFYLVLVRPQLSRLDGLRAASEEIGRENFAVALPDQRDDEIGRLFQATHAMATALAERKIEVESEWARLNQTIAERTNALRQANDALAKTDDDRRRFFADVSHELRTPLTVILMEAELALKSGAADDGPYGVIRNRARRLNQRIDDLLRIARSETGTLTMETVPFDLSDAAEAALSDMRRVVEAAGVEITLERGVPLPVTGDPNWTRQVITGLIENALRHARTGGVIQLQAGGMDDRAVVRVIDNGPGIPAENLDAVIGRFVQAPGGAKSEGFGIGLSLARWIVEQQRGEMTLQSPVPEPFRAGDASGTMVMVFLPRNAG